MINKILSINSNKIQETIHPDSDRSKRNSNAPKHDHHKNLNEQNDKHVPEHGQDKVLSTNFSKDDLILWVKELNNFDCYNSIGLKFIMEDQTSNIVIHLKDKNGHNLQEYLPLQIKSLHSQVKKDLSEIPKGTILNITC